MRPGHDCRAAFDFVDLSGHGLAAIAIKYVWFDLMTNKNIKLHSINLRSEWLYGNTKVSQEETWTC